MRTRTGSRFFSRNRVAGIIFMTAGTLHFLEKSFYLRIMPPYLPHPGILVELSGTAAIVIGVLLSATPTVRWGAWGAILYLLAVFPANIYMALHPEIFPGIPAWTGWARLPLQFLFLYWLYPLTLRTHRHL
jgi:uncharacterized membrane protein